MHLTFSTDDLKPLVRAIVAELLDEWRDDSRLAFSESEAAAMLGVPRHCLRDDRLKGRVQCGKVGRKVVYSRKQLLDYVEGRE